MNDKEKNTLSKEIQEKIVLPKELQEKMLKFFMQTSIPRQKSQRKKFAI